MIAIIKPVFSLLELPLNKATVLIRVDYNIPFKNKKVLDNTKIKATLPTIKYLLNRHCKIILATHLGRPEGKAAPELKTNIIVPELKKLLPKQKITKLNDCIGPKVKGKILQGKPQQIFLLENLRFYKEEEENDLVFAHSLANLADFYVNDAFACSHRRHASLDAITNFLPSAPGFLMERETVELSKALNPERPFIWIIGGAKLDKLDLIKEAVKKADYLLIGGALAFTFLKAKSYQVGMSKIDTSALKRIKELAHSKKIILPRDIIAAADTNKKGTVYPIAQIPINKIGLDIGPKTIELFQQYLQHSKTIVWNGPLGYIESSHFKKGTKETAEFLARLKATIIIGGGETAEIINTFKIKSKSFYFSTGGGATLEFLGGKKLSGIKALEENYQKFGKKIPANTSKNLSG